MAGYNEGMRFMVAVAVVVTVAAGCPEGFADGEGEGDAPVPVRLTHSQLVVVDGVLIEEPFVGALGHPLASGRLRGRVVLLAAEVVDEAYSGALLIHDDPFVTPAGQVTRIDGIWAPNEFEPSLEAAFGDLDDDGDDDVVIRSSSGLLSVIGDDGSDLVLIAPPRRLDGFRGPHTFFDMDDDGDNDVVIAGLNGDSHVVDLEAGVVRIATVNARPFVGALGYCPTAFVTFDDRLLVRSEVCASDGTVPAPPTGPDRVFVVDAGAGAALAVGASADTGLEERGIAFIHDGGLVLTGSAFLSSTSRSGDPRSVVVRRQQDELEVARIANSRTLGTADLDGDGVAALIFLSSIVEAPAAGAIVIDDDPSRARVRSLVVVVGQDRDTVLVTR